MGEHGAGMKEKEDDHLSVRADSDRKLTRTMSPRKAAAINARKSSTSNARSPSPGKGMISAAATSNAQGTGAEREPCNRCTENAKKQRTNALKQKKQQKVAGRYLSINFDELEAQMRQEGQDGDEMVLNKMHPGDINYRDKRLTKMLGVYQDDLNSSTAGQ